jgi:hypothetical protein
MPSVGYGEEPSIPGVSVLERPKIVRARLSALASVSELELELVSVSVRETQWLGPLNRKEKVPE